MSPALIQLITQIVQLAIAVIPELVKQGQLVVELLTSGKDPTEEQMKEIDFALELINTKLAEAVAKKADESV